METEELKDIITNFFDNLEEGIREECGAIDVNGKAYTRTSDIDGFLAAKKDEMIKKLIKENKQRVREAIDRLTLIDKNKMVNLRGEPIGFVLVDDLLEALDDEVVS